MAGGTMPPYLAKILNNEEGSLCSDETARPYMDKINSET
jgi:hypothetical protein